MSPKWGFRSKRVRENQLLLCEITLTLMSRSQFRRASSTRAIAYMVVEKSLIKKTTLLKDGMKESIISKDLEES